MVSQTRAPLRAIAAAAAVLLVLSTARPVTQPAVRPISLSWDANPEPDVAGYIVHVGDVSGHAHEHYDVGSTTSFVYPAAHSGQRYYFTVSAYDVDRIESPPSEEVSATAVSLESRVTSTAVTGQLELRYTSAGTLSGVTALQDGRLLLIDNHRSILLLPPGSSRPQTALDIDASSALTEIMVNSRFPSTHHVFIGVVHRRDEETNEFSIVRYREVQGSLGEGAPVVTSLQFSGAHTPRFTIDDEERIYVAMPAASSRRADPYASNILRFNADGTVPRENHGASPVLARGFSEPANLGWDGEQLLAIGVDDEWRHTAARLKVDSTTRSWPRNLDPVSASSPSKFLSAAISALNTDTNRGIRAFIDESRRVFRLVQNPANETPAFEEVAIPFRTVPVAVSSGFDGQLYLLVRSSDNLTEALLLRLR